MPIYTCTVKFDNETLEFIQLPWTFNLEEVVFRLPDKLNDNDNNPTVIYQLSKTIRNKTTKKLSISFMVMRCIVLSQYW